MRLPEQTESRAASKRSGLFGEGMRACFGPSVVSHSRRHGGDNFGDVAKRDDPHPLLCFIDRAGRAVRSRRDLPWMLDGNPRTIVQPDLKRIERSAVHQLEQFVGASAAEQAAALEQPAGIGEPTPDNATSNASGDASNAQPPQDPRSVLPELWGRLPAQQREQLEGSFPEQLLPKYEEMIWGYFERLAEDPSLDAPE